MLLISLSGGLKLTSRILCASISLLILSFSSSALALTVPQDDLVELTKQSRLVLIGTVDKVESDLGGDKRSIFTFVTLRDLVILRGEYTEKQVKLRFDGGQVGFRAVAVSGIPTFRVSEKVLLFVRTLNPAICPLAACSQGYFRVKKDQAETLVDASGNEIVGFKDSKILKKYLTRKDSSAAKGGFKSTSSTVKVLQPGRESEVEKLKPIALEQFASEIRNVASKLGPELPPEIELEPKLEYGVERFHRVPLKEEKKRE